MIDGGAMLPTPPNANGFDMTNSPILAETVATVTDILGADLERIIVERAVIGLFFTGVKLSTGHAGACATAIKTIPEAVCCPSSAMAMPFPGKMKGKPARDAMKEVFSGHGIRRGVGIATLNALAELAWERRPHPAVELVRGIDAFDANIFQPGDQTVVVGAFVPFLKELKRRKLTFLVLEKDPDTLKTEEMPFYRPAETAREVVPQADVLLITGTTLINDTLEDLLSWARPEARVTLVGPTVGALPDAFLARGADILGGIKITDPDAFLDLLAEGGSGYHFFGRIAEKVVLIRRGLEAAKAA
jgi:uncharacterized protein